MSGLKVGDLVMVVGAYWAVDLVGRVGPIVALECDSPELHMEKQHHRVDLNGLVWCLAASRLMKINPDPGVFSVTDSIDVPQEFSI